MTTSPRHSPGWHVATLLVTLVFLSTTAAQSEIYSFAQQSYSVSESSGVVDVCIRRTGVTTIGRSIQVYVSQSSANPASDFTHPSIYQFYNSELVACQPVRIIDDSRNENTETFTLAIQGTGGFILGFPSTTTVSIRDNDDGVTDGETAGIIIGVLAIVIAVAIIILLVYCRNNPNFMLAQCCRNFFKPSPIIPVTDFNALYGISGRNALNQFSLGNGVSGSNALNQFSLGNGISGVSGSNALNQFSLGNGVSGGNQQRIGNGGSQFLGVGSWNTANGI